MRQGKLIFGLVNLITLLMIQLASAEITVHHLFRMGEENSVINGLPQDAIGEANFSMSNPNGVGVAIVNADAHDSSHYATFNGLNQGALGADFSSLPIDNVVIELWVRTSDLAQQSGDVFTTNGGEEGSIRFTRNYGHWNVIYQGRGVVQDVSDKNGRPWEPVKPGVTLGRWTHLALIRKQGVSRFYVNGEVAPGSTTAIPVHGSNGTVGFTTSVSRFNGDVDEIRIFSFDSDDDPVAALNLRRNFEPFVSRKYIIHDTSSFRAAEWAITQNVFSKKFTDNEVIGWDNYGQAPNTAIKVVKVPERSHKNPIFLSFRHFAWNNSLDLSVNDEVVYSYVHDPDAGLEYKPWREVKIEVGSLVNNEGNLELKFQTDDVKKYGNFTMIDDISLYYTNNLAVESIAPYPVTGSNLAQPIVIKGSNFTSNTSVTLRDLTSGEVFPNRKVFFMTDDTIKIKPIFTEQAATWSVELTDDDVTSGEHQFSVLSPAAEAGIFYIEGPDSVVSGDVATFKCFMRNPTSNEILEVTPVCTLGFVGKANGSGIGGMSVLAGEVSEPTQITLQAFYTRPDDRIGSIPFTVTLKKRSELVVAVSASRSHVSGTNYRVNLGATASGGVPPYTYSWDLDGDGDYDDETEASATTNTTEARTYRYLVRVTDSEGAEVVAGKRTTVNKPVPGNFEDELPDEDRPDPQPAAYKTWNGNSYEPFDFDSSKRVNGLIVITHGITSSGEAEWVRKMVDNIRARTAGSPPNIVVYDWKENADVYIKEEDKELVYQYIQNDTIFGFRTLTRFSIYVQLEG